MRTTCPSSMCSFSVRRRSSISLARSAVASTPLDATSAARAETRFLKCSDDATKSVSHLSWTMLPTLPSTNSATAPWVLARSARSAALASPFSRSHWAAASASPSLASRARLASIMPAPLAWRSAWTSLAVNDIGIRTP